MSGISEGLAPLLVPTHVLALVALGLLAGQRETKIPRLTVLAYALGYSAGAALIAFPVREPPAGIALLALAAIAGGLVAMGWPAPPPIKHALAFATAAALALNSPPQAISLRGALVAQIVTGLAALLILAVIAAGATMAKHIVARIAMRIVGSWITASAVLVLALRLVR
jgi:urease accessory protein